MVIKIKNILLLFTFIFMSCFAQQNNNNLEIDTSIVNGKINTKGYYYSVYNLNSPYYDNKGEFIKMRTFLDNNYMYIVMNGIGNQCGDTISLSCAIKMSEYMLDKNINEFLEDTNKQRIAKHHLWNWGKYTIVNDTITTQWYYNHHGRYFLTEEKGVILNCTTMKLFKIKDSRTKKEENIEEIYYFKPYDI
jgi:hypothetical protein